MLTHVVTVRTCFFDVGADTIIQDHDNRTPLDILLYNNANPSIHLLRALMKHGYGIRGRLMSNWRTVFKLTGDLETLTMSEIQIPPRQVSRKFSDQNMWVVPRADEPPVWDKSSIKISLRQILPTLSGIASDRRSLHQ